jgi:hypothetical protein
MAAVRKWWSYIRSRNTERKLQSDASTQLERTIRPARRSGIVLIKYWLEVSPEEQMRRLEARHSRQAQDLEAVANGHKVLQPLVRLFPRTRRHVQSDGRALGAMACDTIRRQEAGAAQCDLAPLVADSLRRATAGETGPAEAPEATRLHGAEPPVQNSAGTRLDFKGFGLARRVSAPRYPASGTS